MGSMGLVAVDVEQVGNFFILPTHCNPAEHPPGTI